MRVMQGIALCGLLLLGVLSGTPAQAQCDPTQACCRVTNPGGSPGCAGAGNPINLVSGNKYQHEVDLPALPGVLGLGLERHYNSAFSGPSSPAGLFGRGWHFGYETSLLINYAGGGADDVNRITLRQADGTLVFFARAILDPHRFVASDPAQGHITERVHRRHYVWTRPHPDGQGHQQWSFDGHGRLSQIQAASGESVSLQRDPDGGLLRITDPQGREMSIHTAPGQVHIDSPVGRFSYALSRESSPRLLSVTLPDGTRRLYHHEDRRPGLLTGISVVGKDGKPTAQRIGTYAYDDQGRAVLSAKGERADWSHDAQRRQLPGTGLEQVEVAYEADHTVLTNSLGQKTTYRHAYVAHARRLTEIRGAGCATCAEPNVRHAYDLLGRITEVTKLDGQGTPIHATRTRYGARGWPAEVSRVEFRQGKAQPVTQVVRYEYGHPDTHTTNQPTLIARPSVVAGQEHQLRITYNDAGQPTQVTERGFSPIDPQGRPSPEGSPIERSTTYTYQTVNGRSILAQVDGPLPNGPRGDPSDSDVTRYEWDSQGNQIVVLTSPGAAHTLQYDKAGRVRHVRNEQGQATELRYDAQGRLVQSSHTGLGWVNPQIQSLRYDPHGRPVERGHGGSGEPGTDTYRGQWLRTYDTAGRLTGQANALGVVERWSLDTEGHLLEQRRQTRAIDQITRYVRGAADESADASAVPSGPSVRSLADDFGRVVQATTPDGGTTTRHFDAADRLVAMQDALGNMARYGHDPAGRIQSQSIAPKDGESVQTTWRYQGRQLVELRHPTQSERYAYDARGLRTARIVTVKAGDGREHTAITRYEHDETGQLTATTLPDGSRVEHRRNGQEQVVAMTRHRVVTGWLRGLEREEPIAKDFERDLVGLRSYTAGNGVQAQFQRSREGVLARVVYRRPTIPTRDAQQQAQRGFERLLGIAAAHAAASALPSEPGALGAPADLQALIDHRYLWDERGNLLLDAQRAGTPRDTGYAYDARNRLVVATSHSGTSRSSSRYLYDPLGRRVLAQEAVADAADLGAGTRRIEHAAGTHRWTSDGEQRADYDVAGQPTSIGPRRFEWDALGRLAQVRDGEQVLGSYRYSHRGERIEKRAGNEQTLYLYDEARQLSAELDAQGRIRRQYVYAADLPIAVIDTPQGEDLQAEVNAWQQAWYDLGHLVRSWLPRDSELRWLHTNHLGAPEAVTDAQGQVVWRANYAASGRAKVDATPFTLSLRLPGQYEDPETGLHYNGQRYYDPERGQYLSPDPLAQQPGYPDGPNPYSYVRYNPLRYVDPSGLILFAFDGTDNTDDLAWLRERGSSLSNVVRFRNAYNDGARRYVTGVGTLHRDNTYGDIESPAADAGVNRTGTRRIDRMLVYLMEEARNLANDTEVMNIDIVGFSRGAAQARDFANLVAGMTGADGWFTYNQSVASTQTGQQVQFVGRQCVRFRFMGLFDSVLSTNSGRNYQLGIPAQFQYVAHAVALNEYRSQPYATSNAMGNSEYWDSTRVNRAGNRHWGGFPLESIGASSDRPGAVRVERGFIGAHADIGGGYREGENQLSFVALNWMVGQAQAAGVTMNVPNAAVPTSNPVIHDQSNAMLVGNPVLNPRVEVRMGRWVQTIPVEDRTVRGAASGNSARTMGFSNNSMTNADTHGYIHYTPRNPSGPADVATTLDNRTGTVDIQGYMAWLRQHGYCFAGEQCRP